MSCFHVAVSWASLTHQIHYQLGILTCFPACPTWAPRCNPASPLCALSCANQTDPPAVAYSASYFPISVTQFMLYLHLGLWILDVLWTCVFRCPWRYGWFQVWDRKCTSPPLNVPLLWGLDWSHHNKNSPGFEFLWLCLTAPDIHISPVGRWIPRRLRSWLIYSLNSQG